MSTLAIIETGVANTASVVAAFRRCGLQPVLTNEPSLIRDAPRVLLPGVGAFEAGMISLRASGLDRVLRDRINDNRPTMAICLGMQLLFESSEESPGIEGLGILPGVVTRFTEDVRIPQFGWNTVTPAAEDPLLTTGYAYFANSYRVPELPDLWSGAIANHGSDFVAAMHSGNILACQFHPELSGPWGQELLTRWIRSTNQECETC